MSNAVLPGSSSVVFPSEGHQVLSTLVHLVGCSVLSFCFARRLEWTTLSKFCTMAIFIDSWLFVFSGGIVVSGVGMSLNDASCLSGVYLCIVFYGTSKMLIYIFLAEKVHHVWSAGIPIRRFQSRIWILCAFVLLGYVVIFVLMLIAKIGYLEPADADGKRTCIIGLEPMASIPLLTYDVFLNVFLTSLFAYPLLGGGFWGLGRGKGMGERERPNEVDRTGHVNLQGGRKLSNPKLRALAKRTCYAAAVALGTSVVNILILTILHGRQLGWVCLASCGLDVTVNAIVIFLITRKVHTDDQSSSHNLKPKPHRASPFNPAFSGFDKETHNHHHHQHDFPPAAHIVLTNHAETISAIQFSSEDTTSGGGGGGSNPSRPNPNRAPYSPGRARAVASPKHRRAPPSPPHHQGQGQGQGGHRRSQSPQGHSRGGGSGGGGSGGGLFRNTTMSMSTKRTRPSTTGHGGGSGSGSGGGEVESRAVTLSQIGDFATTRDDGAALALAAETETGPGVSFASMGGSSMYTTDDTDMAIAMGARKEKWSNSGRVVGYSRKEDADGVLLHTMPWLLHNNSSSNNNNNLHMESRGTTSSISLEDLQEEVELRTPGSFAKMRTLGEEEDRAGYK